MIPASRREFLRHAGATLVGGSVLVTPSFQALADEATKNQGKLLEVLPFQRERARTFGKPTGKGLGGRQVFDLRKLTKKEMLVSNEDHFIRTRVPDGLDLKKRDPWKIKITGHVEKPTEIALKDLLPLVKPQGTFVLECSGNTASSQFGLLSAAKWDGIPIEDVLKKLKPTKKATRILIGGVDDHSGRSRTSRKGASWIFTLEQLKKAGAFLATKMNGKTLPLDHGYPVRLFVPGWYGCTCAKWVEEIRFVDEEEPATSQMREFARRTHQRGYPRLAKNFRPATMDFAAMPVRVEKWNVQNKIRYRIVGIAWGGEQPVQQLQIHLGRNRDPVKVTNFDSKPSRTWRLWSHDWTPKEKGLYSLRLTVGDKGVVTRRLDRGFYRRTVKIDAI